MFSGRHKRDPATEERHVQTLSDCISTTHNRCRRRIKIKNYIFIYLHVFCYLSSGSICDIISNFQVLFQNHLIRFQVQYNWYKRYFHIRQLVFRSQTRSKYLVIFWLPFIFTLWSAKMKISTMFFLINYNWTRHLAEIRGIRLYIIIFFFKRKKFFFYMTVICWNSTGVWVTASFFSSFGVFSVFLTILIMMCSWQSRFSRRFPVLPLSSLLLNTFQSFSH